MNQTIDMTMKSTGTALLALMSIVPSICEAQQHPSVAITTKADMVSSYVWRGMYESGLSVQPTLGVVAGKFSFTAWGNVNLSGDGYKETDFTLAYTIKNATLLLTDYWWGGECGIYNDRKEGRNKYFQFDNHSTDHILEAGVSYLLPLRKCPVNLSWYTMFWGNDKKLNCNNALVNAYSSYAEISSPLEVQNTTLLFSLGFSPFDSPRNYRNAGFAVTNISVKASRNIRINDKYSLPIFTQLVWNPNREDVHFVFGITLQ